jgi:hypothetical protein
LLLPPLPLLLLPLKRHPSQSAQLPAAAAAALHLNPYLSCPPQHQPSLLLLPAPPQLLLSGWVLLRQLHLHLLLLLTALLHPHLHVAYQHRKKAKRRCTLCDEI